MVNYLDIKWLFRCQKQLKEMADDPKFAQQIIDVLDDEPDMRDELSNIYTRAKRTVEQINRADK